MTNASLSRTDLRSTWNRFIQRIGVDPWMLLIVVSMVVFGMIMVFSSSWDVSYQYLGDPYALFRKQLFHTCLGVIVLLIAAMFPLNFLRRLALPIMVFSITMLFFVLLIPSGDEPRRAILEGSVQPSELAKLAVIIYLAAWMESKGERIRQWEYGFIPLMGIMALIAALILKQPDLSAALTIIMVAFVMFYIAGASLVQTVSIVLGGAGAGLLLVRITSTGRARWQDYLAGLVNIEQASYHVQRSLQAFYTGGIFGRGLGASREKFGLLPVPHTDSVFAVVGEELGLIGAILVLGLFTAFVWRGFLISTEAKDRFSMLLASGIAFWIGIEALINMSVLLGMLPFAGNALPLFSYGGSNLLVTLTAIGLLFNVARQKSSQRGRKPDVTSLDIGRRDRRRSLSRVSRN
ncbi:MAG: cell division protein FtsW [Anaerolineales bacterium]|nr:cell division protein FtsW [Anaerolineales bacterium]